MNKTIPWWSLIIVGGVLTVIFRGSMLAFLGTILAAIGIIEAVRAFIRYRKNKQALTN